MHHGQKTDRRNKFTLHKVIVNMRNFKFAKLQLLCTFLGHAKNFCKIRPMNLVGLCFLLKTSNPSSHLYCFSTDVGHLWCSTWNVLQQPAECNLWPYELQQLVGLQGLRLQIRPDVRRDLVWHWPKTASQYLWEYCLRVCGGVVVCVGRLLENVWWSRLYVCRKNSFSVCGENCLNICMETAWKYVGGNSLCVCGKKSWSVCG